MNQDSINSITYFKENYKKKKFTLKKKNLKKRLYYTNGPFTFINSVFLTLYLNSTFYFIFSIICVNNHYYVNFDNLIFKF